MTETKLTIGYGLRDALPDGATAAWGCRAICTQNGGVDIVWDRQDADGDPDAKRRLLDHLRATAGNQPWDKAKELLRDYVMQTREACEFTLYEDEVVTVKANTNGSGGYLYVIAYLTEEA